MHAGYVVIVFALVPMWTCGAARAQLPPHAVPLAPQGNVGSPTLVHSGKDVHAFWGAVGGTFYNQSIDGGLSWLPAEQLLAAGLGFQACAVDGRNVYCVVSNASGPLILRSADGGSSWSAPQPISAASTSISACALWASSGTLAVVWRDVRTGIGSLFANQSLDGGVTWQPLDTCLDAGMNASGAPRFTASGPFLHVLWSTWNSVLNVDQSFHQRSLDHGTNWLPTPTLLGQGSVWGAAGSGTTVLAIVNGPVLRSTDLGNTWAPAIVQPLDMIAMAGPLVIGISGNAAVTVRSQDGGATWTQSPTTFQWFAGIANANISISGGTSALYVDFMLWCCFTWYKRLYVSSDGGVTWRGVAGGSTLSWLAPGVWAVTDGHLVVEEPMHAYLLAGYGSYGMAKPGSGGIAPELSGAGVPMLGRALNVNLVQARGGSAALIGFSFAGRASTPFGSGTLLVAPPVTTLWSITSGLPTVPGSGSMSVPLAIPNNLVFAGMRVDSQGFVLDPGAADGFASTAGMEMWIR